MIEFTAQSIAAAIDAITVTPTATAIASVLAPAITIVTDVFCTTDPPADPGITAADVADALNTGALETALPAQAKLKDWFLHWYWWQVCQCTSGATPAAPALPNPGGSVGNSTGLPTAQNTAPCWDMNATVDIPQNAGQTMPGLDLTSQFIPASQSVLPVTIGLTSPTPVVCQAMPSGTNHFTLDISPITLPGGGNECFCVLVFFSSAGSNLGGTQVDIFTSGSGATPHAILAAAPTGAAYYGVYAYTTFGAFSVNFHLSFYCPGQTPNTPGAACCPPDPTLQNQLTQILAFVTSIYQSLPTPVTSYADGPAHAGLSGSGHVVLSAGSIAFRTNLTTIPPSYGSSTAAPPYIYDLGWVTPAANTSPFAQTRVAMDGQLQTLPTVATEIFYTLNAGVIATITELTAGP
ncbi:MAG: hypothetical protein HRJ53_07650 [Acidobacteria bacterium Pan2503]|uniref:Uncharacterized protein n=1 Tax=Candidatus Acidiferrum panamense TaxID=2741543 RepID=A0A7V8SWF6_9BACT|nr:hypothetical protein [Candidatus Acidoferrum panamensis]